MSKKIKLLLAFAFIIMAFLLIRGIGIPIFATPSVAIKSNAILWSWKRNLTDGCVHYETFTFGDYVSATVETGLCDGNGMTVRNSSFRKNIIFDRAIIDDSLDRKIIKVGDSSCPFTISKDEITILQKLVNEAIQSANSSIERPALLRIESRLNIANVEKTLIRDQLGCMDGKMERRLSSTSSGIETSANLLTPDASFAGGA